MAQAAIAPSPAAPPSCWPASTASDLLDIRFESLGGKESRRVDLLNLAGQTAVVLVSEQGIDVAVELLDAHNRRLGRSASPVIRTGVATLFLESRGPQPRALLITGKEHAEHRGTVRVRVFSPAPHCADPVRTVAEADALYAVAQAAISAPERQARESAASTFADSARAYKSVAAMPGTTKRDLAALQLRLASVYYYDLSQWSESADWATKAAANGAAVQDAYLRARAQAILAAAWLESRGKRPADSAARFEQARQLLGELLDFHAARREEYDTALQTNNIGLSYFYEGRFEEALPYFTQAQAAFARQSEVPRVALALQNSALCKWGLGDLPTALNQLGQALDLMDAQAHPDLYLIVINNKALANYAAGNYDIALSIYQQALEFAQRVQEDSYRARSYYGIGVTQYALGDRHLAAQFLRLALDVWTGELDSRGRISALRALAVLEHEEKRYDEAIRLNLEAQSLSIFAVARARIEVKIAASRAALGQRARALETLEPIIKAPPEDHALVQAEARLESARIRRASGKLTNVHRDLERALAVFRALQSLGGEFDTLLELARMQADEHREAAALDTITTALALGDEIGSQTANPEYRASVVQSLRPAQEFMIDLLHDKYSVALRERRKTDAKQIAADALAFADNTRAQSFDRIRAQLSVRTANSKLDRLIAERDSLHRTLADRRYYLSTREDRAGPMDVRARVLREDIARLRVELGNKNTEIARATQGRRAGSPHAVAPIELSRVQPDQAFIEYWLGDTNAYAWVVRKREVQWVKLGAGPGIAESARRLHDSMSNFASMPMTARNDDAQRLYRAVVAPLATHIDGAESLVIAADGPLHVVPFAALRASANDRYLVQRHSIAFVPAYRFVASASMSSSDHPAGKTLLVADPVYQPNDPRLAGGQGTSAPFRAGRDPRSLSRLPATAREAAAVQRALRGTNVVLLEGLRATRNSLLSQDLASYRFIHIAAHGVIDTEVPRLSALILGAYDSRGPVVDQLVRVDDLLTATFNAELITLSACNTSLGANFAGEGPIGLRYAVLARGARSVVSSLWPVADETTADLMTEMYGEMNNKAIQADTALTVAMRRLLEQRPTLDPALWAPYTVHLAYQQERKQ